VTLGELVSSGLVRRDYPVASLTTYKFGGPAAFYAEVTSDDELSRLLQARNRHDQPPPIFVLGRGSNVVIAESGFPGIVLKLGGAFNEISLQGDEVVAGAGVALPRLARFCATNGRGGLEFYVGIPGSVGGAVAMNAGGHGSDTAQWLVDVSLLAIDTGEVFRVDAGDLELSYRHSRISSGEVVLRARYRTIEREPAAVEQAMREITSWRREHQPGGTFNAGSVFKNPAGDAAGRIIDSVGLKGFRCGGATVSERHANFFVAEPEASAQDVYDLVHAVQARVHTETGVTLVPEIRFIGDFGEPGCSAASDD
jgi:UDP-N-acetylmuramate dehydrogenase